MCYRYREVVQLGLSCFVPFLNKPFINHDQPWINMSGNIKSYMAAMPGSTSSVSSALQSGADAFAPSGSHMKVTWVPAILALFDHSKICDLP